MASVRCIAVPARPTEFLDCTSGHCPLHAEHETSVQSYTNDLWFSFFMFALFFATWRPSASRMRKGSVRDFSKTLDHVPRNGTSALPVSNGDTNCGWCARWAGKNILSEYAINVTAYLTIDTIEPRAIAECLCTTP